MLGITKTQLVQRLKADAAQNKFSLDGEYLVFDKSSNLSYQLLESFKLKEFLTQNPISLTRLNLNILVAVNNIREVFGRPLTIRATYHSPEYHLLTFGSADSDLYTKGDAISLGTETQHLETLIQSVNETFTPGELGIYKWGVHLGWTKTFKTWDVRSDTSIKQKVKDTLTNDKMKNVLLLGAAAVAGWFFFMRKK